VKGRVGWCAVQWPGKCVQEVLEKCVRQGVLGAGWRCVVNQWAGEGKMFFFPACDGSMRKIGEMSS